MAVKLRLQRKGRKRAPYYHIVVADARSPRDGKYIERIGSYNPMTKPATIEIDRDSAFKWLMNGAQPTDTVRAILRFKGVLYKKHLHQGVMKGAMTEEQAEAKYNAWIESKDATIASRFQQAEEEKAAFHQTVFGKKKAVEKPVAPAPSVEAEAEVEATPEVENEIVEAPQAEAEVAATPEAEATAPEAETSPEVEKEASEPEAEVAAEVAPEAEAEAIAPEAETTTEEEAAPVTEEAAPIAEEASEEVKAEETTETPSDEEAMTEEEKTEEK